MRIEVRGLDEVQSQLSDIAARAEDLSPILEVVVQDIRTAIDDSFNEQSSPSGARWQPLAQSTLDRRKGTSATILVDTGRLRNSIAVSWTRKSISFGTNVAYGGAHQFGYTPRRLPARPFMPVESDGGGGSRLMTGGRASALWEQARADVDHYIRTGEIAG